MTTKITCGSDLCENCNNGECAAATITVNEDGVCQNYEEKEDEAED